MIYDTDSGCYYSRYPDAAAIKLKPTDTIIKKLLNGETLVQQELLCTQKYTNHEQKDILSFMKQFSIEAAVPIGQADDFQGCLLLGSKPKYESFHTRDIQYLEDLCRYLAPFIPQIRVFQEHFRGLLQRGIEPVHSVGKC